MALENRSLKEIARTVGTNDRRVRQFLDREGIKRSYPTNYGGNRCPSWNGGKTVSRGYVRLLLPNHPYCNSNGYVLEHRLVMERLIGRHLLPEEVVHHKDGNKSNNDPSNLVLFSENREHLAHELRGKCPKWTPEGLERMKIKAAQGREILRKKILEASKLGVPLLRKKRTRPQGLPVSIPQLPSQTESQPEPDHPKSLQQEQSVSQLDP